VADAVGFHQLIGIIVATKCLPHVR
jgi:hypothetical protein